MKRIEIFLLGCLLSVTLASCNDKFMEKLPLDQINDSNFWQSELHLELYCNKLYENYIKGFGIGWGEGNQGPWGYNEASIAYGDIITDNAAPSTYSKVAANEFIDYISGGSGSNGWNWDNMRSLNYFLNNYNRATVDDTIKHIYAGEILFFKAWDYFEKVKLFGDVPWINEVYETNSPGLTSPRNPRSEVMDSVLATINQAIAWLPEKGQEKPDRLNKDVAQHLKARICLYEGTYRKYHTELGLDGTKFLNEAVTACEALMNGAYHLYSTGKSNEDYNSMFAQYTYKGNPEVLLSKEYSVALNLGAAFSRYYAQNSTHQHGATRALVDEYLCTDGLSISSSPMFKGKDSIQQEMTNRDPRLRQTVCNFGEYALTIGLAMGADNAPKPNIPGLNGNKCPTGYRVAKWFLNDPADWDRTTLGQQAAPIFRYAEVLLNYAEAKFELGQATQDVIDRTVNVIRDRVAMPHLMLASIPTDPVLDGQYATYCDYTPAPLLREIRRERRVEFAFENFRWDDLMRWKAGHFLEIPVEGIKFVQKQFPNVAIGKDVFLSSDGFLMPYAQTLPSGRKFEDKQYLFPIPVEDLVLNPNLTQNPGWEGAK